jgi:hypothetical protein
MKKSWLVAPIASAILLGNCTFAFADGTTGTSSNATTSVTTGTGVSSTTTTPSNTTTPSTTSVPSDPSVMPGDYCYDVAASAQDISITVSVDNSDKAQLLTQYALNQIAQAKSLLQSGNQALAQQLIIQIVTDQTSAMDLAGTATTTASSTASAGNGVTGTAVSAGDAQTINTQIGHNLVLLMEVLNQVQDPQEQAALVSIIQTQLQTLVNQLGQHNVQVNFYVNADNQGGNGDHEGDHGDGHHGDGNQGDESGNNND